MAGSCSGFLGQVSGAGSAAAGRRAARCCLQMVPGAAQMAVPWGGDAPGCVLPYRQSSQPPWGLAAPKCPKIRDLGTAEHPRRGHIGAGGSSPSRVGVAAAHPKRSSPAPLWSTNPKQPFVVNSPSLQGSTEGQDRSQPRTGPQNLPVDVGGEGSRMATRCGCQQGNRFPWDMGKGENGWKMGDPCRDLCVCCHPGQDPKSELCHCGGSHGVMGMGWGQKGSIGWSGMGWVGLGWDGIDGLGWDGMNGMGWMG